MYSAARSRSSRPASARPVASGVDRLPQPLVGVRGRLAGLAQHAQLVGLAQAVEAGRLEDEREAVGERDVERLGAVVGDRGAAVALRRRRRVHRRPAVAEPRERHSLGDALVDEREELVLELGTAARDLVEEHRLRLPHRGRRLQVDEPAVLRHGIAEEVVEAQDRGVVVAEGEAERRGQARQKERLRGPVRPDEEDRRLGGERREDRGLERVPAGDAERAEEAGGGHWASSPLEEDTRKRGSSAPDTSLPRSASPPPGPHLANPRALSRLRVRKGTLGCPPRLPGPAARATDPLRMSRASLARLRVRRGPFEPAWGHEARRSPRSG